MRKITRQAAEAFRDHRKFSGSNTIVTVHQVDGVNQVQMFLHGNLIASELNGELMMTLAGWGTPTTRERLNGLLNVLERREGFWQKDYCQFFGIDQSNCVECGEYEWVRVDLLREAA